MPSGSRRITVEFLGNNRDLNRAMDDSIRRSGRFGSALRKAGRVAGYGLAAGAVIAAKGLWEMGQMAAEDEKAQAILAGQLKRTTGATDDQIASVEDWIKKTSLAKGIADDQLRPALGNLATATEDVAEAQGLLSLAMDVSAGRHKSLEQVTEAFVRAQNGSVGGLGRLGIATKNAAGETKTFAEIQDDLRKKFKGAADEAAGTTSGKFNRLKITLQEMGEEIGAKLLPVAVDLADWFLEDGLPAIQKFGNWVRDNVFPIFQRLGDLWREVTSGMSGDAKGHLGELRATVMEIVSAIRVFWDRWGEDIIKGTKTTFKNLVTVIGGVLRVIRGLVKTFSSLFRGDWKGVWQGVKTVWSGTFKILLGLGRQLLTGIKQIFKVGMAAAKGVMSAAWDGIKALVSNKVSDIVEGVKSIPGKIREAAGRFKEAGKHVIGQMLDGLSAVGGFAGDFASNVWSVIRGYINSAIGHINSALPNSVGPIDFPDNPIPTIGGGSSREAATSGRVSPLSGRGMVSAGRTTSASTGAGGGAQVVINVNGALDPMAVGKQIEDVLRKYVRGSGRPLQVAVQAS